MKQVFTIKIDYPLEECKIGINEIPEIMKDIKKVFRGVICEDCEISVNYWDVTTTLEGI